LAVTDSGEEQEAASLVAMAALVAAIHAFRFGNIRGLPGQARQ
jgi:hypothetical protein